MQLYKLVFIKQLYIILMPYIQCHLDDLIRIFWNVVIVVGYISIFNQIYLNKKTVYFCVCIKNIN